MNILFDHQTFSLQRYGGISRYFRKLIDGINHQPDHQADLSVLWSDNPYAQRPAPLPDVSFRGRGTLLYHLNQRYSQRCLRRNTFDVFHATYYDPYFLKYLDNRPFVITLHDMTHERLGHRFPELSADRFLAGKHELVRQAQAVIAVSKHTKQDIVELLGINPDRVHVVYHASSLQPVAPLPVANPPYLLFVGNRGHYKNFIGLLNALARLPKALNDLRLICAGGGSFSVSEQVLLRELSLQNRVSQQAFRSDAELATLYGGAMAFVFPSFYEGFGMPVLEAFTCSCPCLLSQTSSLPEVAGDAALYFNPEQPDSIAHVIEQICTYAQVRTALIRSGSERTKAFNWTNAVCQTTTIYESTLNRVTNSLTINV